MREIKFRGIDIDSEKWTIGNLVIDIDGNYQIWDYACHERDSYTYKDVNKKSVGQFTGLKDKTGKEIYEGDIVKWTTRRYKSVYTGLYEDRDKLISITWKSAVEWDMQSFCITESFDRVAQRNNSPLVTDDTLEIIGNIHETPELLK